ncbi:heparan-alpha-glucosaminide N-acetyltransferase domain-containing protein [Pseudonocardia alaniniphila]|uniref:Heparan-alpha-glucosaminide N-acetyltransferase domain-containing protein n=1 Tax=Pseudonocardia alaniniphila TaxID=75291 RepID=A0ABS9TPV8_9PSEU|nr:heparan-alpha-glucosaminide N-acetyltransferase domain-containing protein [Pseudonocardia alaniniphila]MCH6170585.1 heparan-alpha-glucosaminide N-acetyltransferase domain-containing protein [Pseudonocardia alaniniphila]
MTESTTETEDRAPVRLARIEGVDLARGLALLGMIATHVFDAVDDNGAPTAATIVAAGRSAASFAMIAGVSLALISGRQRPLEGRDLSAMRTGILVRAIVIGAIGLAIGFSDDVDIILPYYAVLFLLAIPLLRLQPRMLVRIAIALAIIAPLLNTAMIFAGLPRPDDNPTFATLFTDPVGLFQVLFLTGYYPVLAYLAYICVGLAIGRCDLTSALVARRLLFGGIALVVLAWAIALPLLYGLGGIHTLSGLGDFDGDPASSYLLWDGDDLTPISSWWWLALPASHSTSWIDMINTIGSAMAVIGGSLLLVRVPLIARLLRPITVAGTMALTIYTAHVLVLATGVLDDEAGLLYLVLIVGACVFALLWRRFLGQGPLERLVAELSGRARRAVLTPRPVERRA